MNPPFPEAAEPVRQKIRELVERPKALPKPCLKTVHHPLRWPCGKCPELMVPYSQARFQPSIAPAFWRWWDSCTDAQNAVDTVWGKK